MLIGTGNWIMRQFSITMKISLLETVSQSRNISALHVPISYSACKRREKAVHETITQCSTQLTANSSTLLTLPLRFQQLLAGHHLCSFQAGKRRTEKGLVVKTIDFSIQLQYTLQVHHCHGTFIEILTSCFPNPCIIYE